jgi:hypothetical protein
MIKTGDFIFVRGRYVTAKWQVVAVNDDLSAVMHQFGPVKKEYVHPTNFFYPGRSLWKGGLPAYAANSTLERDYEAFQMKTEAQALTRALVKVQKRLPKIQSSEKVINCTLILRKAVEDLKLALKKKRKGKGDTEQDVLGDSFLTD